MSIELIQGRVRAECQRPENVFGEAFFDQHLAVVADYGRRLAEKLGADTGIVETAAYLHDLSAVRDVSTLPDHPRLSAEIARELLAELDSAPEQIERIARCILTHSTPLSIGQGSLEEVCLSNADAISQIVRPTYFLFVAYSIRKLGYREGRQWLLDRIEANWSGLIPQAKDLARDDYLRARDVLS